MTDLSMLPPPEELFVRQEFAARHPRLLSENRVYWAVRNRRTNGLIAAHAVYESPCGELVIHEPSFIAWFLGLSGRAKPRVTKRKRAAARGGA